MSINCESDILYFISVQYDEAIDICRHLSHANLYFCHKQIDMAQLETCAICFKNTEPVICYLQLQFATSSGSTSDVHES